MRRSVAVCAVLLVTATSACSPQPQSAPEVRRTVTVAPSASPPPTLTRSPSPTPPATSAAEKTCAKHALAVLSGAIADVVAHGDVGSRYAAATRKYGKQSEEWRLASLLFPPVYAQLDAHGAGSAKATADALVRDGCRRLYEQNSSRQRMNMRNAEPIELPRADATTTQPEESMAARSCYILEE